MTSADRPTDGRARIGALRRQHQALEDTLRAMEAHPSPNRLQIARVKERVLALQGRLLELESGSRPEAVA
jgi:hypothetical protein